VNVDAVESVLAAFESGTLSAAAACFAAGATYREARRDPIRGRDAIGAWFERFEASGATWRFTVDDVIRDGTRACVAYRFAVLGGTSEPARERAGCAIVRVDDCGLIAEWREYEG
jgi:ketosteroid isomerase-like protein